MQVPRERQEVEQSAKQSRIPQSWEIGMLGLICLVSCIIRLAFVIRNMAEKDHAHQTVRLYDWLHLLALVYRFGNSNTSTFRTRVHTGRAFNYQQAIRPA